MANASDNCFGIFEVLRESVKMSIQNDTAGKNSTDIFAEAMCLPRENTVKKKFCFEERELCF